jgi:FixJ family two-component response regulator
MSVAIVDDDESVRRSMVRLLRAAGFRTTAFQSADEFLAVPLPGDFGCLVFDIQLRGTSGFDLHRQLRARGDTTPVIYITGREDPVAEAQARRLGCAGFFGKLDAGRGIIEVLREIARSASCTVSPVNPAP